MFSVSIHLLLVNFMQDLLIDWFAEVMKKSFVVSKEVFALTNKFVTVCSVLNKFYLLQTNART